MSKHSDKIKQAEDEKLMALVEKLQQEISLSNGLDNMTLDMSDDNIVVDKILRAEYAFLYDEARYRHASYTGVTNAISQ
ncbi:YaaL family protein [Lactobacillus delbrueckii]|uniref:YaaL family protein n=1 Tax=Lactobacillus delbrueckii TaxID=1584 RepID=UPI0022A703B5|nr:YaaL family protein [Lactobacillus delbrueckii]MCZ0777717.1 YaaL family protein [Lactobacillus delbrueckii subsp. sunkii]MCZ0794957.1 YaaL family protein [Lactobacillus delbrueckii]